ncbi:MAG: zinc ribbon domain-containing protein, partial [Solirubrobacteraceae bacterium]
MPALQSAEPPAGFWKPSALVADSAGGLQAPGVPDAGRLFTLPERMRLLCPTCQSAAPDGAKFCIECGTALLSSCSQCGAPHARGQRFCADCGSALPGAAAVMT